MPKTIENLVAELGPTLSTNLVKLLCADGIDQSAARQRVSRAKGEIKRLRGISFPNREAFLFLSSQFPTQQFKTNLAEALELSGSAFGRLLFALEARGGACPSKYLPIISGQPIDNTKKQLLHSLVEEKLRVLALTSTEIIDGTEFCRLWKVDHLSPRRRAIMIIEDIVLSAMRSWLAKVGWTSSESPTIRGIQSPLPKCGQFA